MLRRVVGFASVMVLLFSTAESFSQFRRSREGGDGSPGRFGSGQDLGERFSQYSGGRETWERSRITDREMQERFDRLAERMGVSNGVISRQQYLEYYERMRNQFRGMGFSSPSAVPGRSPSSQSTPALQGGSGPSRSTSPPRTTSSGPSTQDRRSQWADRAFRRYDRNGDGILSNDEMPDTLRNERDRWDRDRNGLIDMTEYLSYFQGRMQQFQEERASLRSERNGSGSSSSGGDSSRFRRSSSSGPPPVDFSRVMEQMGIRRGGEEDFGRDFERGMFPSIQPNQPEPPQRPVVYHPGNLPSSLPPWFEQRDTDRDGQVGLYEWRAARQPLGEFERMDSNNDGLLTPQEVLRFMAAERSRPDQTDSPDVIVRGGRNGSRFGGNPFERDANGSRGINFDNLSADDRARIMEWMRSRGQNGSSNGSTPSIGGRRPQGPSNGFSRFGGNGRRSMRNGSSNGGNGSRDGSSGRSRSRRGPANGGRPD